MVTLALMGDVMLGRGVNDQLPRHPPAYFWGDVLPLLRSADAALANLKCAVTRHAHPWAKTPKVFHFRRLRLVPVRLTYAQVHRAQDFEFAAICERMSELSSWCGTPLTSTPEGLELGLDSNR